MSSVWEPPQWRKTQRHTHTQHMRTHTHIHTDLKKNIHRHKPKRLQRSKICTC